MSLLRRERAGGIAILTLDDAPRRNLLSPPLCAEISAAVAAVNADPEASGIVLAGAGGAFCAGADLADLLAAARGDTQAVQAVYQAFIDVADSALPTLAAVDGAAIGAGFNLALACDRRIAGPAARFETRFLRLGLHPGGGHGWMLLRAVGWAQASRLLLGGLAVDAAEALRIGLVEAVAEDATAAALAAMAPLAGLNRALLTRTRQSLRHAATASHAEAFARETAEQLWSLGEPGFQAGLAGMRARLRGAGP